MSTAWTLMTAMPPTKGHANLKSFVGHVGDGRGKVIVATQPDEPMAKERYDAVNNSESNGVDTLWLHRELPQDPNSEGFWLMWYKIMTEHGFKPGDIFVSSEPYGAKLAEVCDGIYMPYDIDRELLDTRATRIRKEPIRYFADIMPEFQRYLRTKVTFWGAESTGKTTLSKEVAGLMDGHFLFEYARPYLEAVGPEINIDSMRAIWRGQRAIEDHANNKWSAGWLDKPYLFQDTDLFSTVGYWEQPHWTADLGEVPVELVKDAQERKSDLYIITRSNIAFEKDPIRYGGDHRESPDSFWIGVAEKYNLPYAVLNESDFHQRVGAAMALVRKTAKAKTSVIKYERQFNG